MRFDAIIYQYTLMIPCVYFGVHDNLLPICELYYVTVTFLYSEKRYSDISISLYFYWLIDWFVFCAVSAIFQPSNSDDYSVNGLGYGLLKFPWRPSRAFSSSKSRETVYSLLYYEVHLLRLYIRILSDDVGTRQYYTSLYTSIHVFPGPTDMVPFSCLHESKLTTLLFIRLRSSYIKVKCKINRHSKHGFFLKWCYRDYCCLGYFVCFTWKVLFPVDRPLKSCPVPYTVRRRL